MVSSRNILRASNSPTSMLLGDGRKKEKPQKTAHKEFREEPLRGIMVSYPQIFSNIVYMK